MKNPTQQRYRIEILKTKTGLGEMKWIDSSIGRHFPSCDADVVVIGLDEAEFLFENVLREGQNYNSIFASPARNGSIG